MFVEKSISTGNGIEPETLGLFEAPLIVSTSVDRLIAQRDEVVAHTRAAFASFSSGGHAMRKAGFESYTRALEGDARVLWMADQRSFR